MAFVSRALGVLSAGAVLLAAAGCGGNRDAARFAAAGTPSTRVPAAAAGGACYLLEYETIEQTVGTAFDVAAASTSTETFTCVLQASGQSLPDLILSVTPVAADVAVFTSTVAPKDSAGVEELGRVGYTAALAPAAGTGPGVEVGWLSGNGRLLVLRYRCPAQVSPEEAAALTPKLVTLARKVDQNSV
ncbi:hypothetical protein ACNTMW_08040 [Planosporangium sp. 12N6]|uniref:hypothetical protein n=1 Tax=Planosporangium spinosum TaxID=3402278 RepID=UPI003CF5BB94